MADEVTLVECTNCGAPNHPERRACGRCRTDMGPGLVDGPDEDETQAMPGITPAASVGTDQDTPPVGARPRSEPASGSARVVDLLRGTTPGDTQPLDPVAPEVIEARPLTARPVLLVTLVGLGLGLVVGAVGAVGMANREDPVAAVEQIVFDAETYDQPAIAIGIEEVDATSFLSPTGDNRYEPSLVLDRDPATAWNSDGSVREDGLGEVLTIRLSEPAWVTSLEIANGYQKDDVRFLANARIARAAVVFDDGSRVNVVLLDQTGLQRIPLPSPMLTTTVRIEVLESFPGDTYEDLAVSELTVFGHGAIGIDRTRATERADAAAS